MKQRKFTFTFAGGKITVMAFHDEEAKILAQAEAIRRGWNYTILR